MLCNTFRRPISHELCNYRLNLTASSFGNSFNLQLLNVQCSKCILVSERKVESWSKTTTSMWIHVLLKLDSTNICFRVSEITAVIMKNWEEKLWWRLRADDKRIRWMSEIACVCVKSSSKYEKAYKIFGGNLWKKKTSIFISDVYKKCSIFFLIWIFRQKLLFDFIRFANEAFFLLMQRNVNRLYRFAFLSMSWLKASSAIPMKTSQ